MSVNPSQTREDISEQYMVFDLPASMDPWPDPVNALMASPPGIAAFDLDHTLIAGDIGEDALRWFGAHARIHPETAALLGKEPWAEYLALCDVDLKEAAVHCARGIAGQRTSAVQQWVESQSFPAHRPVVELAQRFEAAGHQVWIVTGSAAALARALAPRLGLSPDRVLGVELEVEHGWFTPVVPTLPPMGAAKIAAIKRINHSPPMFAIGDSASDIPLLRYADLGIGFRAASGSESDQMRRAGITVMSPSQWRKVGETQDVTNAER